MSVYKFESHTLKDILDHVDQDTMFLFDIDHTLIEPAQIIGSTYWENAGYDDSQVSACHKSECLLGAKP